MTTKFPPTVKSILLESPLMATRLWLVMGSLTWAILLFWPGDVFTPSRTTYHLMAAVAPEEAWALAFLVHSIWAFYTLRTGVRNRVTLTMDALLGCVLWTSSTLLCFAAHWPHDHGPGFWNQFFNYPMPGELWMSIASWWHLVRYWADDNRR